MTEGECHGGRLCFLSAWGHVTHTHSGAPHLAPGSEALLLGPLASLGTPLTYAPLLQFPAPLGELGLQRTIRVLPLGTGEKAPVDLPPPLPGV